MKPPLFQRAAVFREPAGARTQDPNIKSVVLYLLSYGFSVFQSGAVAFLVVQMYGLFLFYQNKTIFLCVSNDGYELKIIESLCVEL